MKEFERRILRKPEKSREKKKTLFHLSTKQGLHFLFNNRSVDVLANFFYPPKGNFLYPFLLPFPLPKTENQKVEKKEKRTKIKQKKKTNFLQIFPVAPLIFSP